MKRDGDGEWIFVVVVSLLLGLAIGLLSAGSVYRNMDFEEAYRKGAIDQFNGVVKVVPTTNQTVQYTVEKAKE